MIQQPLFPEEHLSKPSWFTDALDALGIEESSGWPDVFGTSFLKSQTNENPENIRVLSLFSGGGGLDIGFHDAGFQIVECNELVQDFASTLSRNSTSAGRLHGSKIVCRPRLRSERSKPPPSPAAIGAGGANWPHLGGAIVSFSNPIHAQPVQKE